MLKKKKSTAFSSPLSILPIQITISFSSVPDFLCRLIKQSSPPEVLFLHKTDTLPLARKKKKIISRHISPWSACWKFMFSIREVLLVSTLARSSVSDTVCHQRHISRTCWQTSRISSFELCLFTSIVSVRTPYHDSQNMPCRFSWIKKIIKRKKKTKHARNLMIQFKILNIHGFDLQFFWSTMKKEYWLYKWNSTQLLVDFTQKDWQENVNNTFWT